MEDDIDFYQHFTWLRKVNLRSPANNDSCQERLTRLEGDKKSLVLQVSVLTDQVEAQGEKIRELENSLDEHQLKLNSTEEMLQQELLSRTSLETQKLDLMGEVSYLKLKLMNMDEKPNQATDRQHKVEGLLKELRLLQEKVDELEEEKEEYERKLRATKAQICDLQKLLLCKNSEIENLHTQLLSRTPTSNGSAHRDEELHSLRRGMETLIAANNKKDKRIEELTILLEQFRRFRVQVTNEKTVSVSSEEEEQRRGLRKKTLVIKPQPEFVRTEIPHSILSPLLGISPSIQKELNSRIQPKICGTSSKTGPGLRNLPLTEQNGHRQNNQTQGQTSLDEHEDREFSIKKSNQTEDMTSSQSESVTSSDISPMSSGIGSAPQSPVANGNGKNNKSIRKLWGKLRMTQSGGLHGDDLEPTEFRRGGLRATAGPRLAHTPESGSSVRDMSKPFCEWSTEQVCGWLKDCGLGQYVNLSRQWVESGQTLLSATPQDFEKEMGIKNLLHRKKLQLALRSLSTKTMDKSSELDHIWVTRWLDDIGLPQYKDQFLEGRVDGRMVQHLTVNDLLLLKVTSQLHHLSVKCAIHVLHANKFNPHCLRRRPGDENKTSPSEVIQWSNHRVMEWLRSVDLAEYAPNLRGSGVHGGLMILEPRFTVDTLALLLNIPPQKTLLRRHLATNFSALVGLQAQQEKHDHAHAPLTTTAKVRPKKLSFTHFGPLRKRRSADLEDYICPVDTVPPLAPRPYGGFRVLSPILNPERREQLMPSPGQ